MRFMQSGSGKGAFRTRYTEYSLYYSDDNGIRHSLGEPARDEDSTILSNTVLYTRRNDGSTSKLSAMKTAVNSFIDQVAENAAGDTSTTEDNVSIGSALSSSEVIIVISVREMVTIVVAITTPRL